MTTNPVNDVIKLKGGKALVLAYVRKGEGTAEEVTHLKDTLKEALNKLPAVAVVDSKLLSHVEVIYPTDDL